MKDPTTRPSIHKERGGPCPDCKLRLGINVPTVARRSRKTKGLYCGCTNFAGFCRFHGCRSH